MATADELRQQIATNRGALRDAITAASDRWEAGDEENWSPRKVAEHAIGSDILFVGWVATAMQAKSPEPSEPSFASSADAASLLDSAGEAADKVLRYVEDRDLAKAAPLPDGIPLDKTVEGVLQLVAYHLKDHAGQIAGG